MTADERRDLSPDEFGDAVSVVLDLAHTEDQLAAWGAAHAATLAGLAETHPQHHRAARAAYARRLQALRNQQ